MSWRSVRSPGNAPWIAPASRTASPRFPPAARKNIGELSQTRSLAHDIGSFSNGVSLHVTSTSLRMLPGLRTACGAWQRIRLREGRVWISMDRCVISWWLFPAAVSRTGSALHRARGEKLTPNQPAVTSAARSMRARHLPDPSFRFSLHLTSRATARWCYCGCSLGLHQTRQVKLGCTTRAGKRLAAIQPPTPDSCRRSPQTLSASQLIRTPATWPQAMSIHIAP